MSNLAFNNSWQSMQNDDGSLQIAQLQNGTRGVSGSLHSDPSPTFQKRVSRGDIIGATAFICFVLIGGFAELSTGMFSAQFMAERTVARFVEESHVASQPHISSRQKPKFVTQPWNQEPKFETPPRVVVHKVSYSPTSKATLPPVFQGLTAPIKTSSCSSVPKVAWWSMLSHQQIISYVKRVYGANWLPYLDKWDKRAKRVADIYSRGNAVRIPTNNMILRGPPLATYVKQVKLRAEVNHCLAMQNHVMQNS